MTTIKLKRSDVPGKVPLPGDLELGELALNTADGNLFLKKNDGTVEPVRDEVLRQELPDLLQQRVLVAPVHPHYKEPFFETERVATGFPQGFTIDEEEERVYIGYSRGSDANTTYSVHSYDGTLLGTIMAGTADYPEGFAVVHEGSDKFLYTRSDSGSEGSVGKYNITSHPLDGSVVTPVEEYNVNMHYQMSYDQGVFYLEQRTSFGTYYDRQTVLKYDSNFNLIGVFRLPLLGSNENHELPKKQSFFVKGSYVYSGVGGIPRDGSPEQADSLGVYVSNTRGDSLVEAVYPKPAFMSRLNSMYGTSATGVENEGIFVGKDNSVYSLWVISPRSETNEIKILRDFVPPHEGAVDFSDIVANVSSPSMMGSWIPSRVTATGDMYHPTNGSVLTSLTDIFGVLYDFGLPEVTFYSQSFPNIDYEGVDNDTAYARITIYNMNNATGFLHIEQEHEPLYRYLLQYERSPEQLTIKPLDREGMYISDANDWEPMVNFGNYRTTNNTSNIPGSYGTLRIEIYGANNATQSFSPSTNTSAGNNEFYRKLNPNTQEWTPWYKRWSTANTTVDGNGFIKEASPVAKVFRDRIVTNEDAAGVTYKREGVGVYRISGSTGLSDTGWYIDTPKDANNNIKVFVELETEGSDIILKTYEPDYSTGPATAGAPADIPEGRWVDLRFNEVRETDELV